MSCETPDCIAIEKIAREWMERMLRLSHGQFLRNLAALGYRYESASQKDPRLKHSSRQIGLPLLNGSGPNWIGAGALSSLTVGTILHLPVVNRRPIGHHLLPITRFATDWESESQFCCRAAPAVNPCADREPVEHTVVVQPLIARSFRPFHSPLCWPEPKQSVRSTKEAHLPHRLL